MESSTTTLEKVPELYAISEKEFRSSPVEIKPYTPPEKVTRDNFINFLILSFRISRGIIFKQNNFIFWLSAKNGFDYQTTFSNLLSAGVENSLSAAEIEGFLDIFKTVGAHTEKYKGYTEQQYRELIITEIESILGKLSFCVKNLDESRIRDLRNAKNISEFNKLPWING